MWNTFFITSCTLYTATDPAVSFHVLASRHIYFPCHARCHLCQILPMGRGTLIKWHQSVIYYFTQAIMINQPVWRLNLSAFLSFIAEELQLKCNPLSDSGQDPVPASSSPRWIRCSSTWYELHPAVRAKLSRESHHTNPSALEQLVSATAALVKWPNCLIWSLWLPVDPSRISPQTSCDTGLLELPLDVLFLYSC